MIRVYASSNGWKVVEFQNQAQVFIYQALQARRQRAGVLSQKTTVEGEKLRDIHDRVAGEARRARGQAVFRCILCAPASALPVLSEDYANNSWARINLCATWTPCGHRTAQVSQSPHRTAW